jgi:hypothetical protein
LLRGVAAAMALLLRGAIVAAWPCCYVMLLLQRWRCGTTAEIFLFLFFYSRASGEKMRARKRKRSEIRNLFPNSIG